MHTHMYICVHICSTHMYLHKQLYMPKKHTDFYLFWNNVALIDNLFNTEDSQYHDLSKCTRVSIDIFLFLNVHHF